MEQPTFISPEVKLATLEDFKVGSFTEVAALENLPPELQQKVPEGYVIKKYTDDYLTETELFADDFPEGREDVEDLTPLQKAAILKDRQQFIASFFSRELPDFVVKSQFVVGADGRVYEIQKRIKNYYAVYHLAGKEIERLDIEAKKRLREQAELLLTRTKQLVDQTEYQKYQGRLPDFSGIGSVVVTSQGDLKTFDTNHFSRASDRDERKYFADFLEKLEKIIAYLDGKRDYLR